MIHRFALIQRTPSLARMVRTVSPVTRPSFRALLEADLGRQLERPQAGGLAESSRALVEHLPQALGSPGAEGAWTMLGREEPLLSA